MIFKLSQAGRYLLNVLLPRACAHCGRDLHHLEEAPLCTPCRAGLRHLAPPYCTRCGLPLADGGASCYDCRGGGPKVLSAARSALVFNPQLRSLVHAFKYSGRGDLAGFLAAEMAAALDSFPELEGHLFAVPVPLHPARLAARGYNQAELLAAALAKNKGLFHLKNAARRVRDTPSQTALTKVQRRGNIAGAFAASDPGLVKGRKILLVDDVATTLSTLEELAATLKAAGAKSVAAFTLAREP